MDHKQILIMIQHHFDPKTISVSLGIAPSEPQPGDREIAERVLNAYHASEEDSNRMKEYLPGSPWSSLVEGYGKLFDKLRDNDIDALTSYLAAGFQKPISLGIGPPGYGAFIRCSDKRGRLVQALLCKDKLALLAVALGILPVEGLEQGHLGVNMAEDSARLLKKVERVLGFSLIPPDVCGAVGLKIGEYILPCKSMEHGYVCWRMRTMFPVGKPLEVCEIGAGFGGVAFYFCKSGPGNYHIFDLPTMNLMQGFYLCKTLGPETVALFGETPGNDTRVHVKPFWCFERCKKNEFDIAVNQDSMPEIKQETVEGYLQNIKHSVREKFFSINQEGMGTYAGADVKDQQIVVPWLVKKVGGFTRSLRVPYWLRRGYAEEVYEINAK